VDKKATAGPTNVKNPFKQAANDLRSMAAKENKDNQRSIAAPQLMSYIN